MNEIERSIPNISLNHETLVALVREAFPDCNEVDEWKLLSGGALNTTYSFTLKKNRYVLRLYARERALCKREAVIHQLIDARVPTPRLIYANESHEVGAYSIFEFIPGKHISEISPRDGGSLSYELGRVLATIHGFKLPQAGLFGDGITISHEFIVGSSPYYEEALSVCGKSKYVRQRLGETLTEETIEFIQKHKEFFPTIEDNICLTHSDFKPMNLLYQGETVFVLDWEFAHAGVGILDFAVLLRHRTLFPYVADALVKGYTDHGGTLPDDWFRSALILDFINMLQLLDSPSETPQLFQHLRTTIRNTLTQVGV